MKKIYSFLLITGFIAGAASLAHAGYSSTTTGTTTSHLFTPTGTLNLQDMAHTAYFTWGINWQVPTNETIIGAELFFSKLWDNTLNDRLYVHLLDTAALGVMQFTDTVTGNSDYFASSAYKTPHALLTTYSNISTTPQDKTFTFGTSTLATLNTYLANDSVFGLGFDPDCHYYDSGINLKIITEKSVAAVPEPATMLLFGTGLAGIWGARARRKK